jgi:transposase
MPATSKLPQKFYEEDLVTLSKTEPIAQIRIRYIGLSHIQDGSTIGSVAKMLRVDARSVTNWISRYKKGGLEALKNQKGRGVKRRLPKEIESNFRDFINKKQEERKGGRLLGEDIRKILNDKFDATCSLTTTYDTLKRAGMSWITSRSRHPKQSDEVQELFKKLRRYRCKCNTCGSRL